MSLKSIAAKVFAKYVTKKIQIWASTPHQTQEKVFQQLIKEAKLTAFGKDHDFQNITSYQDFTERVPIRDYEQLRTYVERVVAGEENVLWPGKPLYFAKTSGTTSGSKYIPLTKESMPTHIHAARNAILCYIAETGKASFVDGKMIFLQGSPEMTTKNGIGLGRLSGIVAHYVPGYLQKNRLPSWETNCMEDWEKKVDAIVAETIDQDMRVISGIPPWVQMYFERLKEKSGKPIGSLFKNFELFIYGGVNYEPYRPIFRKLNGKSIPSIELYPASEGFFAFQDSQKDSGMLLQLDSGIFYEFVKSEVFFDENPPRLLLKDVVIGENYVMLISTNAGLWAYNLGDTIQFTSTSPYRVIVSGRIKHFISAFGEHVIGKEVEQALQAAVQGENILINEFTVAPQIEVKEGQLPYHEWFIEFSQPVEDVCSLAKTIDDNLRKQNSYYDDLITGKILEPLHITPIRVGGFTEYMKSIGKLGGQNKLPRLANDRKIADQLQSFKI
ncbi:GH3 auxin-responsive promoter family protein [Aquimarina sp. ERC-38]|uniref:GH3 auxin-responsive promoter family protein n=1 Tax=Aquimarina sp. ERC-38 TaxID=2949996 RepID=UPI00224527D1|nr:GH3 auxin-responsive promoter family protein [Aquimarina sp. ERC-38]UZO81854.1 GH3 auxin-responsive promoter family protein [Aquimarina sp. ERC-38]